MGEDNGASRPSKHGMNAVDQPGKFRMIHKDKLHVDPTYQRDAVSFKVDRIAAEFSWVAFGAIGVGNRDGCYYVFDGDHRVLGARKRSDVTDLPCMVFDTTTAEEEAEGFLLTNQNRRPLSSIDKFKAQVVVGLESAVLAKDLLDASNYSVSGTLSSGRLIKAIGSMVKSIETDKEVFLTVWPLILQVAAGGPIFERVLRSIFYLQRRLSGTDHSLVRPPWRQRVVALGSHGILDAAGRASAYYSRGGENIWARGLAEALNKGVRIRLPYETNSEDETEQVKVRASKVR